MLVKNLVKTIFIRDHLNYLQVRNKSCQSWVYDMIQEIAVFLDKFQTKAWFRTLACSVLSLYRKILDLGLSVETPRLYKKNLGLIFLCTDLAFG